MHRTMLSLATMQVNVRDLRPAMPQLLRYADLGIFNLMLILGAVDVPLELLEENANKGFIKTGIVQFGVGVSISPIRINRQTNTNKPGVQEGKNAGMAPLAFRIVEHGVYCMPFFVNPNFAGKTGCTADDIELLKILIPQAYDLNRSAIRADVRIRHAWYIEHKNNLGSCPDYLLLDAFTPKRIGDITVSSMKWDDYEDKTELPEELKTKVVPVIDLMTQ